ncbi:MAG: hypothetical protein ACYTF5_19775 [Planctomycetota bacterium]
MATNQAATRQAATSQPATRQVHCNQEAASQDTLDRAFVLENIDRLRWRGGRMVLV